MQFSFKYNKSEEGIVGIGNTDDTHAYRKKMVEEVEGKAARVAAQL